MIKPTPLEHPTDALADAAMFQRQHQRAPLRVPSSLRRFSLHEYTGARFAVGCQCYSLEDWRRCFRWIARRFNASPPQRMRAWHAIQLSLMLHGMKPMRGSPNPVRR